MNKKVTVVGSFIVDLMARTPHLPKPGETVKGLSFKMGPGGKGSNQAIAAKRANCDVTFVSKVGKDEFGDMALNTFRNEGLDTEYIFVDENLETGTALIMVDDTTSQNEIVVTSGACDNITSSNLDY
ncbi:MAG: PfkB family carbohydrate kinase, partial [Peptostreptococcaceae bacterium]